ncbi:MAG: hypothetical protein ACLVFN_10905, partial [Enterocloster sp.]
RLSTTFLIYFFVSFETSAALSSAKIILANLKPFVNNFFYFFNVFLFLEVQTIQTILKAP